MVTCFILNGIHVAGTRMKRAGIDGFSRWYLLELMMTGQNPLEFIPMIESADERSGGRVVSWINYWCKDSTWAAWWGRALKRLSPDYWFELHTQDRPRLWTPPPSEMGTVVEVFNEDILAHPHIPHIFSIPRWMNHMWRRQLYKDADFLFTINVGP